MLGPYIYHVRYWDDFDEVKYERQGITFAESYREAMEFITAHYGDQEIIEIKLFAMEPQNVVELSEEEVQRITREREAPTM